MSDPFGPAPVPKAPFGAAAGKKPPSRPPPPKNRPQTPKSAQTPDDPFGGAGADPFASGGGGGFANFADFSKFS